MNESIKFVKVFVKVIAEVFEYSAAERLALRLV